jgi:colanic acid/amylovoran biosynthesis protein
MRYAFYCHGGSQNHGCEAIVKTLSTLIKAKDSSAVIKLYTFRKAEDEVADLPYVDEIEEFRFDIAVSNVDFADKIKLAIYKKSSQKKADDYYYSLSCKNPSLKENDIYISVGGDNYCYGDSHMVIALNRELKRLGKPTVLWGCSIGDEDLTDDKIEDLKSYDLIVSRESLTYNTLISHGINKNTVLYPDSAFTLDISEKMNEEFPVRDNTVGINVSSLINSYADKNNIAVDSIKNLIEYIIENTQSNIVLVPHVTREGGSDSEVLSEIFSPFDSDRITIVDSTHTASEYKSVISRCTAFVGARTHSTIAAYSTYVPTLVIGYSVKSKGIAKDLFGTDEGLVIPVWELKDENYLTEAFIKFCEKKDEYKAQLEKVMPEYIARAKDSINELFKIKVK